MDWVQKFSEIVVGLLHRCAFILDVCNGKECLRRGLLNAAHVLPQNPEVQEFYFIIRKRARDYIETGSPMFPSIPEVHEEHSKGFGCYIFLGVLLECRDGKSKIVSGSVKDCTIPAWSRPKSHLFQPLASNSHISDAPGKYTRRHESNKPAWSCD